MDEIKTFSVIIAEDELPARKLLEKFVNSHPELTLAKTVTNGRDALKVLSEDSFDLLLLDINLPVMSGIEVLENLNRIPYVIFTTAYNEYAVQAFDIGAVDYLLKPIFQKRFNKAVDRFITIQKEHIPYDVYHRIQEIKGPDKYKKSSLSEDEAKTIQKKILKYMESSKPYRIIDITLQDLAEKIDITPHQFSQVINQKMNKNLYDFLNQYRVEDAKKALTDIDCKKNIIEIAQDVGFKSKSTFNRVFMKFCDITPSDYRKKFLSKNDNLS